jgi:hypothetical protein
MRVQAHKVRSPPTDPSVSFSLQLYKDCKTGLKTLTPRHDRRNIYHLSSVLKGRARSPDTSPFVGLAACDHQGRVTLSMRVGTADTDRNPNRSLGLAFNTRNICTLLKRTRRRRWRTEDMHAW